MAPSSGGGRSGIRYCTREEEVRWRRMVLCMAVDGLFPPESRRTTMRRYNRCNQLLRALFGAGSTIGRLAREGRRLNFPHVTGCHMRLRARLAARSRDQAAAVEASGNEDGCETEADDPFSWASTEGPSAEEVGRAFLGDPEAESAGHGGWRGSAAQASSPLRSLLLKFKRPQDENEHGAASMCAGGNGEDCACHGGAFFADHSCDSDFGGDGHAALAAALLSETRDTDQVTIFTGVAAGAADGRLDCSSKWAAWFEDDCCDFDLEVPEPSMLRYDGVAGNRTREPERNQQDPQRAKTDVDNGPLPQERFEKRPTGQRSHSVSSLPLFLAPSGLPCSLPPLRVPAMVSEALTLHFEGFPTACLLRWPLLGLVPLALVGRRWARLLWTCFHFLFPPLGLGLSPLKGCHRFLTSSARLALIFQVAPGVPEASVGRAI